MFILSDAEVLPTLSDFMEIQDIPKKYGGQLDYTFGQMPNLAAGGMGEMVEWAEGMEKGMLPAGPIKWERAENGDMVMVNVGSVGGVEKRDVIGTVKRQWEEVLFPGRKVQGTANGEGKAQAEAGGAGSAASTLAPTDTVPSAPTSAGPPVSA